MTLFRYPDASHYGKVVPKARLYERGGVGSAVQRLFVAQVEKISWEHVLSRQTTNLPEAPTVKEIQVFCVHLRVPDPDPRVLRALDESIPSPLVLELVHGHRIRMAMAWKRPHIQDPARKVVGDHFLGPWHFLPGERTALPPVRHLEALQEVLFRSLLPEPPREGELLSAHLERLERIRVLERERLTVLNRLGKEVQFNRKMELHERVLQIEVQLGGLRAPLGGNPHA